MFISYGRPYRLSDLGAIAPDVNELKRRIQIAVLDDEPFIKKESLSAHGFHLVELGGDIKSVDQLAAYPLVIVDIRGVGKTLGSQYEGAHVIEEIRKSYPDKFLILYSGATFDISYNPKMIFADKSATKDASIEYWVELLEYGLMSVGDPIERWKRFRNKLIERGIDLYDIFKLEQAFIKSVKKRNKNCLTIAADSIPLSDDIKDLVVKFSAYALAQIVDGLLR